MKEIQIKKFECNCGMSYNMNSSLYNHIRLKHSNERSVYQKKQKVGRPAGVKNSLDKVKEQKKKIAKILTCKCGDKLSGEGALSNHIRLRHNNEEEYRIEKKKQGRPKAKKSELIEIESNNLCQSLDDSSIEQPDQTPKNLNDFNQSEAVTQAFSQARINNTQIRNEINDQDCPTILPEEMPEQLANTIDHFNQCNEDSIPPYQAEEYNYEEGYCDQNEQYIEYIDYTNQNQYNPYGEENFSMPNYTQIDQY